MEAGSIDAMVLQTSSSRLSEKALQDNATYDQMMRLGVAKEQSEKGAAILASTSGFGAVKIKEIKHRRTRVKEDTYMFSMWS